MKFMLVWTPCPVFQFTTLLIEKCTQLSYLWKSDQVNNKFQFTKTFNYPKVYESNPFFWLCSDWWSNFNLPTDHRISIYQHAISCTVPITVFQFTSTISIYRLNHRISIYPEQFKPNHKISTHRLTRISIYRLNHRISI